MDWIVISAIANMVMAFGSLCAVAVALWSTIYVNRPRIKLTFNPYGAIVGGFNADVITEFISVSVTNVCNRNVSVRRWMLMFPSSHQHYQIMSVFDPIFTQLPYELKVDETVSLQYDLGNLHGFLIDRVADGSARKDERIVFLVEYGPAKRKSVRSGMSVGALIDKIERHEIGKTIT